MTTEKAIKILDNERPHCGERAIYSEGEVCEAFDMAITSLRSQQFNDPLTLDELKEMEGEPVYIVYGAWKDWRIPDFIDTGAYKGFIRFTDKSAEPIDEYGKNWMAYRYKIEED